VSENTNERLKSFIRRFTLYGVHGYKNLSVDFYPGATVIAAQNGAGKTTLLGALNAFLTRRFHRLASYSFSRLECLFEDTDEPIIINKEDLPLGSEAILTRINVVADEAGINPDMLSDFLASEYSPAKVFDTYRNHPIVRAIFYNTSHTWEGVKQNLDGLFKSQDSYFSDYLQSIKKQVHERMKDVSVIYLPTYRRVELPLLRSRKNSPRVSIRNTETSSPLLIDMAFGLGDVEQKLKDMFDDIEKTSNMEYRVLSAKMLGDMLRPASLQGSLNLIEELPDVGELSRFLTRLGRADEGLRDIFRDIEVLYSSGRIFEPEYSNLRWFLLRLKAVILKTRIKEQQIENFVEICNSFLEISNDEKVLTFDPKTLRVVIKNKWLPNGNVPFDALSSGEKQIISLMAKLYLDDGRKLILIDEPELSLSIPWQKKVLPSMLNSGAVAQLFAITHSPFIFDNELEANATELKISYFYGEEE